MAEPDFAREPIPPVHISGKMTAKENSKPQETRHDNRLTICGEKRRGKLTEELVEEIISRIPFPSLFKTRVLSSAWYYKFPFANQRVRSASLSLQNLVKSASSKWPTYCPVYVTQGEHPHPDATQEFIGFDQISSRWQILPGILHLPIATWDLLSCSGPLICIVLFDDFDYKVFITNTITGSWRELYFSTYYSGKPVSVKIILVDSLTYKVVVIFKSKTHVFTAIYHATRSFPGAFGSTERQIVCKKTNLSRRISLCHRKSVYLDGKLYYMREKVTGLRELILWILDMEKLTWSFVLFDPLIHGPDICFQPRVGDCSVVLCGNKIMVAVCYILGDHDDTPDAEASHYLYTLGQSIQIYELEVNASKLNHVFDGPYGVILGVGLKDKKIDFASNANFIFFGQKSSGIPVLTCNVDDQLWSCLPPPSYEMDSTSRKSWMSGAFEPGLSPFLVI